MLTYIFIGFLIWCAIGVFTLRKDSNTSSVISMMAHNVPYTGLTLLIIAILCWPIRTYAILGFAMLFWRD